ncbi:hypothetical protein AGR13a_Lc30085 [Agrobacterium genomosp. 13 str. CFBP 6927]|uniref:Uncharacterized protein n=1 Tax=Agrobacterium genomosp. 13 str. CFBP 6927 TaxID=1183428 RepID=A0ABP2BMS9_9HYPH|nr:hypothetical protein AGR13a_Lc30085 [Agrobacterium genomosp. 13 str. CFBP 6927]
MFILKPIRFGNRTTWIRNLTPFLLEFILSRMGRFVNNVMAYGYFSNTL